MKLNPSRKKKHGQVLLLTAFMIFVLYTLALSFFRLVPMELNSALKTKQAVNAQTVADSGVKEARVWLESQPAQKIITQAVLDNEFNAAASGAPISLAEVFDDSGSAPPSPWRYDVVMTRNPTSPFAYDVVSTCYFEDNPMRQVRATIARESFSRYALFIDQWDSSMVMEAVPGAIQGPFHTNDFFRLYIPPGFYGNGGDSFVTGSDGVMTHAGATTSGSLPFVATSGDGNAYFDSSSPTPNNSAATVPYNANGEIASRYEDIVKGGRTNLSSTDHVILPYSADELYVQSLGGQDASTVTPPSQIGLYVPTDGSNQVTGGIFAVGDVDIELSIDSNGDQVHTITQSIPVEYYRNEVQESYNRPVYGTVQRTLDVGSTYSTSSTTTQTVDVQQITGYQTETRTTTRQVQTGQRYVSGGGGGTTVGSWQPVYETVTETTEVQVPIYETVQEQRPTTVTTNHTITDPNDPLIGTTVDSYEVIDYVPDTRTRVETIDKDTYEANPGAFPNATKAFRPGPPKTATITEVSGPSPRTIFVDYDQNRFDYNGSLNGVTFVEGSVKSLKGISKGAQDPNFASGDIFQGRYVVANPAISSKGELTVTDDLLQFYNGNDNDLRGTVPNTLKVGMRSPNSQHGLGLVSRQMKLKPRSGDPLNLYGVLIAGRSLRGTENAQGIPQVEGGFGADASIMTSGYGMNTFNIYGGLVQANQQLWQMNGNGLTGNFIYDPAVAGDLPRFPRSNLVTTLRYADRYVNDPDAI